jgi:predicted nicotinamide N-methyase
VGEDTGVELVERDVTVAGRTLALLVPADAEALLCEEAFAHEEFLPYWAELWPSGLALAEAVAVRTGRVLELGCGLGIPSLVAALGGADVVATDWAPDAIALLERNAARVGAAVDARRWGWTDDPAGLSAELVIAADVLYEARNGPQLLAALAAVVAPGGEALICDPGRPAAPAFFEAAAQSWTVTAVGPSLWRLSPRT